MRLVRRSSRSSSAKDRRHRRHCAYQARRARRDGDARGLRRLPVWRQDVRPSAVDAHRTGGSRADLRDPRRVVRQHEGRAQLGGIDGNNGQIHPSHRGIDRRPGGAFVD